MPRYIVMDIGCIECGEPSDIVGVYKSWDEAQAAGDEYANAKPQNSWGRAEWTGQHYVQVFKIPNYKI